MLRLTNILAATALSIGFIFGVTTGAGAQVPPAPGLSAVTPTGPFLLNFDENGNATIAVNGGATNPLTGTLMADPSNPAGGGELVLTYLLPEPVVTGDVSFAEPGTTLISDWLRFTDSAGTISGGATGAGARMIFYSDFELGEPPTDLADTGFPADIGTQNSLALLEVGPEGNNGFDYQPGGVPYPQNNEYIGISDLAAVPEPASLALLGSFMAMLGLAVRRRRQ